MSSAARKRIAILLVISLITAMFPIDQICSIMSAKAYSEPGNKDDGWIYIITEDGTAEILGHTDTSAEELTIPLKLDDCWVRSIGENAFAENEALQYINVPGSILRISPDAFPANTNLKVIGWNGCKASEFAKKRGLEFISLSPYDFYDDIIDLSELAEGSWSVSGDVLRVYEPYACRIYTDTRLYIPPCNNYPQGLPVTAVNTVRYDDYIELEFSELSFEQAVERYSIDDLAISPGVESISELGEGVTLISGGMSRRSYSVPLEIDPIELSINKKFDNIAINGTISITNKFLLDVDFEEMVFNRIHIENQSTATLNVDLSVSGEKATNINKKGVSFLLFKMLPIRVNLFTFQGAVYAYIEANGKLSLGVSLDSISQFSYIDGLKQCSGVVTPKFCQLSAAAEVSIGVRFPFKLRIGFAKLGIELSEIALKLGVTGSMSVNSELPGCANLALEGFLTLEGKITPIDYGVSVTKKQTLGKPLHWETDIDNPVGHFVEKCTREDKHTVEFITGTSQQIESQAVENGGLIVEPEKPVRDGYAFYGWYTDPHYTSVWLFEDHKVYQDIVLYAKWDIYPESPLQPMSTPRPVVTPEPLPEEVPTYKPVSDLTSYYPNYDDFLTPEPVSSYDGIWNSLMYKYHEGYSEGTDDDWYEIVGYSGNPTYINIPSHIDGNTVSVANTTMFRGCKSLVNAVIANGFAMSMDFIGCTNLQSVTYSESVSSIYIGSFVGCTNLKSIKVPEGVISIRGAFANCTNLTDITLPSTLEFIGEDTFFGCSSLESITLPSGIASIDYCAFAECSKLKSINIPASVTSIGNWAFAGCSSLESIEIPDSVKSIDAGAFAKCTSLKSIDIPSHITEISSYTFLECSSLEEFSSETITAIGQDAFSGCTSLSTLNLKAEDNIVIDTGAFSYCTSLKEFVFDVPSVELKHDTFFGSGLESIVFSENFPNTTALSGYSNMFARCANLVEFINDTGCVTEIDFMDFVGCSALSVLTIDGGLYEGCDPLRKVIPNLRHLTILEDEDSYSDYIPPELCKDMVSLETVIIEDSAIEIDDSAFENCINLKSVTFDSVYSVGDSAFKGCISLESSFSAGYIGDSAFEGCTSLLSGGNSSHIGDRAYKDCTSLTTAGYYGNINATYLGDQAFMGCTSLKDVTLTLPYGYTESPDYGDEIFRGCTSLDYSRFTRGLIPITPYMFTDCSSLKSVSFEETGLTEIGEGAFMNCTGFYENLPEFPDTLTEIGKDAFKNCTSIVYANNLPDSITEICEQAFMGCTKLLTIRFPESLNIIGSRAFDGCDLWNYSDLSFNESLTEIGSGAFRNELGGCYTLYVPGTVQFIGDDAFAGWDLLQTVFTELDSAAMIYFPENHPDVDIIVEEECDIYPIFYDTKYFGIMQYSGCAGYRIPMIAPPEHESFVFLGWYKDSGLTEPWMQDYDLMPDGPLTLYAKWSSIDLGESIDGIFEEDGFAITELELNLESAKIPTTIGNSNVTSIRSGAIGGTVENLHIHAGITSISAGAFANAHQLKCITVDAANTHFYALDGVLYNNDGTLLYYPPRKDTVCFTVPDGITEIASYAFYGNSYLEKLIFPSSFKRLAEYAVYSCDNISMINFASDPEYTGLECLADLALSDIYGPVGAKNLTALADKYQLPYNEYVLTLSDNNVYVTAKVRAGTVIDAPADPAEEKYRTFIGWSEYADGSELWDFENGIMPANELTLYAIRIDNFVYEDLPYGLKIVGYRGSDTKIDVPHYIGNKYIVEIAPGAFDATATLTLIGEKGGIVEKYAADTGYAFEPRKHIVTFVTNGGTYVAPIEYYATETIVLPSSTKYNHTLDGWRCPIDGWWNSYTPMPERDMVLYAIWEKDDTSIADVLPFEFETTENGLIITKYLGNQTVISIPEAINGIPVVSIGDYAFSDTTNIYSVTIPGSITCIGKGAFMNSRISSVTFSNGTETIGEYAFANCAELTNVVFADTINSIGNNAFHSCTSLYEISLPESLISIGDSVFANCSHLTSIKIGANTATIDISAFSGCRMLHSIDVSSENMHFASSSGVLFDASYTILLYYPEGKTDSEYSIPDGVVQISNEAMQNSHIAVLRLCNSLQSLGNDSLRSSYMLKDIIFCKDGSLETIGSNAFSGCSNLRDVIIPDSVLYIGQYSFFGCNLNSISIPKNTYIGTNAISLSSGACIYGWNDSPAQEYAHNHNLRFIAYESSIPVVSISITESASITVGSSVQLEAALTPANTTEGSIIWSISPIYAASIDQNGLVTGLHPGSVTVTATAANGATATCAVTVTATNVSIESIVFGIDCINLAEGAEYSPEVIILPENADNGALTWTSANNDIAICTDGKIQAISAGSTVITVTAPNGLSADFEVTVISSADYLTPDMILPQALTLIDEEAFMNSAFTAAYLPEGVVEIASRAFADCNQLKQIDIPASVTVIADDAFEGFKDLVIYLYADSRAEDFAIEAGINYVIKPKEASMTE